MAIGQFLDDNGNPIYYDENETPWIPPGASFDPNNPSGAINAQNPTADPNRPFVQEGETGGYIDGIGTTVAPGHSTTPAQAAGFVQSALNSGISQGWIDNYLARNPYDYSRMEAAYNSEQTGSGPDAQGGSGGSGGSGGGGGGGGNQGAFAPPPNTTGWMPELNLPTWTPPPAFSYAPLAQYPEYQRPADYVPGEFSYGEYQPPADYVPGEFTYADYVQPADYVRPADYVPGTFSAPTIEEARGEPGFQFALDEGRRQMEASAAAKGIGRTGGTVKRLIGYGQNMADTNYGNVFNRTKSTFDTNEGNRAGAYAANLAAGLGEYNTNLAAGLAGYTTNRGNALENFTLNESNRAGAYNTNLAAGLAGYTTNRGNAFENFTTNENNRAGAYNTNAALGFGAWDANRANAANTYATNYGVAKDTYDYGYKSSADKHAADTLEATGEYAPRKEEAILTHQQAFAEWLAKMGIAKDIFAEGSD